MAQSCGLRQHTTLLSLHWKERRAPDRPSARDQELFHVQKGSYAAEIAKIVARTNHVQPWCRRSTRLMRDEVALLRAMLISWMEHKRHHSRMKQKQSPENPNQTRPQINIDGRVEIKYVLQAKQSGWRIHREKPTIGSCGNILVSSRFRSISSG